MFGHQTPSNIVWWPSILPLEHLVWCSLIVFNRLWSYLFVFDKGHQTFDRKVKTFLLFLCLMDDVLFVWTAAYQTCLKRAWVPRLLSGLYQLFHLCLIKHVLTVWPLTSTLPCLVTKQCLMVFGRQTFPVCPGPNICFRLGEVGFVFGIPGRETEFRLCNMIRERKAEGMGRGRKNLVRTLRRSLFFSCSWRQRLSPPGACYRSRARKRNRSLTVYSCFDFWLRTKLTYFSGL